MQIAFIVIINLLLVSMTWSWKLVLDEDEFQLCLIIWTDYLYSSFWFVAFLVNLQGEEHQTQTVDGLLQALGLQKYVILFKAEEVCHFYLC